MSGDKLASTQLHGVVLLPLRVGDGGDVCTQSFGKQQRKVTETTDSDDTDVDAGAGTVGDERVVHGHSSTEHGSGHGGVETVRNLDDKVPGRTVVRGVPSVTLGILGRSFLLELAAVGPRHLGASVLLGLVAFVAFVAAVALSADTDNVSLLDVRDLGTDLDGDTDNLVSDDLGVVGLAPSARGGVQVGAALWRPG